MQRAPSAWAQPVAACLVSGKHSPVHQQHLSVRDRCCESNCGRAARRAAADNEYAQGTLVRGHEPTLASPAPCLAHPWALWALAMKALPDFGSRSRPGSCRGLTSWAGHGASFAGGASCAGSADESRLARARPGGLGASGVAVCARTRILRQPRRSGGQADQLPRRVRSTLPVYPRPPRRRCRW